MSYGRNRRARGDEENRRQSDSSPGWPGKVSLTQFLRRPRNLDAPPVQQRATTAATPADGVDAADDVHAAADAGTAAPAQELPFKDTLEASFGQDLSHVRAHVGGEAGDAADAMGAEAYATGQDVVFAGAPTLHTVAHEVTHVLQQREGVQLKGGVGEVGDAYEREADDVADAVVRGEAVPGRFARARDAAAPGGAVQRKATVKKVDSAFEPDAAVAAKTVEAFVQYTRAQADWSTRYASPDKPTLQRLLHDLLENDAFQTGTQDIKVSDLLAMAPADRPALDDYCAAVHGADQVPTAKVEAVKTVARAVEIGKALPRLVAAVGNGGVLYHITSPKSVGVLLDSGRLDELILYCRLKNPMWQAPDDKEFDSFLKQTPGVFIAYALALPDIRNPHRFGPLLLQRLVMDRLGGNAGKPLSLILHAGLDHSGAFHHDENLTKAVTSQTNRVVMIEGKASLGEIQGQLGTIAANYGGGTFDQVMIAGHGESRMMELAGTTTLGTDDKGKPKVWGQDDTIDLRPNAADPTQPDETVAFFDELLRHMGGPNRRIVLNACLTASNDIKIDPNGGDPALQIRNQLRSNASLAETVRSRFGAWFHSVDVVGANASFPEGPELADPAGRFDIIWSEDKPLTAASKLDYVKEGREPTGVLRAILQEWKAPGGGVTPPWLDAVNDRMGRHVDTWYGVIIEAALGKIQGDPANAVQISELAQEVGTVAHAYWKDEAHVSDLSSLKYAAVLFQGLPGCSWWPGEEGLPPIAIYQVWGVSDATKYQAVIAHLTATAGLKTGAIEPYIEASNVNELLKNANAASPSLGHLLVAWSHVLASPGAPLPAARTFLRAVAKANGGRFPPAPDISTLVDNGSEEQILKAIGIGTGGGGGAEREVVNANVDRVRDGRDKNETFVERIASTATVINCKVLRVRSRPGRDARVLGRLKEGDSVFAFGKSDEWYAVEFNGGTGFVSSSYVMLS